MVKFRYVRWKNLLSTGNVFTEVQLDRNSTTLIVGENGAGKSTILDALCFGLFGKPFRKINKPQLVNTINEKGMLVEVEFDIGSVSYKVVRGIKPAIFEIYADDKLLDQTAALKDYQEHLEKTILKLNYQSFTQIVILGSSTFIPFMQLPAHARRDIIEELLDIKVFSSMNTLLKEKLSTNKNNINDVNYSIELNEEKIQVHQKHLEQLKESENERNLVIDVEISKCANNGIELQRQVQHCQSEIQTLQSQIENKDEVNDKLEEVKELLYDFKIQKAALEKDLEFYSKHEDCPKCAQKITKKHKELKIDDCKKKIDMCDVERETYEKQFDDYVAQTQEISKVEKEIQEKELQVNNLKSEIKGLKSYIIKLQKDKQNNAKFDKTIEEEQNNIHQLEESIENNKQRKSELLFEKELLEHAALLLKDTGIKTQIVKKYVPIMNQLINKYLASMEFFIQFELDENFNEIIRSRHRDDFSYSSFSEGEKARINIALLLTWRAIAKMKNTTNTNLLIFDETFDSSLDAEGIESLNKIFREIDNANIFVISHKGDSIQDKFRSVIRMVKHKNFSRIEK